MSPPAPLEASLVDVISRARWFGGKGRAFSVTDVRVLPLREGSPDVSIGLVTLSFEDGGTDVYQVPLASYAERQGHLAQAFIAEVDDRHVYDAMHDPAATHAWLEAFRDAADGVAPADTGLSFHSSGKHDLDVSASGKLFSGEQSNSSVVFGDDALMKVFRRVTPGVNPDIEIHDALTRGGADGIAALYGWVQLAPASPDEPPLQLAMLQQFLSGAADGWDLALASAGSAVADGTGDDFTDEARRLGVAVREVHDLLRRQFGTQPLDGAGTAEVMRQRLEAAIGVVPDLVTHRTALEDVFARLSDATGEVQRVHGDLHLGQTLRTEAGWKLVDFEGEPAKPLAERRLPDSPWRDVAGMLRSFDYAALSVTKGRRRGDVSADATARAGKWLARNRAAFLEGYLEGRTQDRSGQSAPTTAEEAIINAYEADKAVYEVTYEARNRPTWVDIPLQAIDRIGADS
jgi:maltokinase